MGHQIKTVFKHWFTGKDNQSFEIMRALTALSILMMIFYIGWHLVMNKIFDPLAAATGLGALLFGGGAGAAVKDGRLGPAPKIDAGPGGTVNVADAGGEGG